MNNNHRALVNRIKDFLKKDGMALETLHDGEYVLDMIDKITLKWEDEKRKCENIKP